VGPSGRKLKYPSHSFLVVSLTAIDPVGATACTRAARFAVCPTGAYSVCASPVLYRARYHFAGGRADAGLHGNPAFSNHLARVSFQFSLYAQRGMQRALRVVFVCDGGTEHREDAVPGGLGDVAAVVVHRIDHQLEGRIDDCPRFLRVEVLFQLGRASDIGGEHGDGLSLALDRGISGSGVYLYGRACISYPLGFAHRILKRLCTFEAELRGRGILRVARRASTRERRSAFHAEFRSVGTFSSALRAAHSAPPTRALPS
jgi:hypothetical protein